MDIQLDSHCIIGSSHHNCEDYALVGRESNFSYAIVSDGCSSSKNTDVGARIISYCAKQAIIEELTTEYNVTDPNNKSLNDDLYESIGHKTAEMADHIRLQMGLNQDCLDASLLIAIKFDYKFYATVLVYGDGNVIASLNGKKKLISLHYNQNMPHYLSYRLNAARNAVFQTALKSTNQLVIDIYNDDGSKADIKDMFYFGQDKTYFQFFDVDYVAVSSDGMESFMQQNISIPLFDMFKKFTDFKNMNGEFIKRRMNAIERECDKNGIKHYDDISMAAIFSKKDLI